MCFLYRKQVGSFGPVRGSGCGRCLAGEQRAVVEGDDAALVLARLCFQPARVPSCLLDLLRLPKRRRRLPSPSGKPSRRS
jgi:hypothetical protein